MRATRNNDEAAADEAVERYLRIETAVRLLLGLTAEQCGRLLGLLPDRDDLAVLAAALRCEREVGTGRSALTEAFGLPPKWRSQSRRLLVRGLITAIPTKATEPCPRAKELDQAFRRHGSRDPYRRVIEANGGRPPAFSTIYR